MMISIEPGRSKQLKDISIWFPARRRVKRGHTAGEYLDSLDRLLEEAKVKATSKMHNKSQKGGRS
ncbi:conserved hypothetical protein [Ricinus communis]|uniref:Uncharacterized protein n=1 Tax=Ricinus communis TaxID=3988 RepID=B9RRD1_RICCO|nr:conserved hypothetical protein [Ricinus communis]